MTLFTCLKRLRAGEDGVTAVEFALVAPVFLLLIFGTLEFSVIMFAKAVMEGSTGVTSRLGKTGFVAEGISRQDMLITLLKERSQGILTPEKVEISTLVYQNFADIGEAEPLDDTNANGVWDTGESYNDINGNGVWDDDMGKAGLGGAGDIVVYTVMYPWKVMTPIMASLIGDDNGNFPLESSVVVRNEPYGNGG